MSKPTDLDVSSPEETVTVLRRAAEMYYQSAFDLAAAWQEASAGSSWKKIARVLADAANRIEGLL